MMLPYPDLGSASDWLCHVGNLFQQIGSTTQIWVVTRHEYEISALVSQMSFGRETSGSVTKLMLSVFSGYLFNNLKFIVGPIPDSKFWSNSAWCANSGLLSFCHIKTNIVG